MGECQDVTSCLQPRLERVLLGAVGGRWTSRRLWWRARAGLRFRHRSFISGPDRDKFVKLRCPSGLGARGSNHDLGMIPPSTALFESDVCATSAAPRVICLGSNPMAVVDGMPSALTPLDFTALRTLEVAVIEDEFLASIISRSGAQVKYEYNLVSSLYAPLALFEIAQVSLNQRRLGRIVLGLGIKVRSIARPTY